MPPDPSTDPVDDPIAGAYALLDSAQPAECLALLRQSGPPAGRVAASIESVARALLAEAAGANDEAERHFERARELAVPLAGLLRVRGRHHKKYRQTERAFECYSLLEALKPGAIFEFWQDLTPAERTRYAPWTVGRMLASSPPRLYPLQPTKAALVEALGTKGAACIYSPLYRPGKSWRLLRLGLDSLMDHARTRALAYEELIAPRDVLMSAPAVYGGRQLPGIAGRTRSVFLCVLPDIVVSSKSNLLLTRDRVLMDYQGDEITRAAINLDADPIVLGADAGMLDVLDQAEDARHPAIEEAFSLVGVHTANFGHWIFEFMFQVWLCMDKPGFGSVPLIVDEQMPPQLREMLELFVGPHHPVMVLPRGQSVRVGKLWCCSRIAYWPGGDRPGSTQALEEQLSDAERLAAVLRSVSHRFEFIEPRPSDSRRLYLRRKDQRRRRMINRLEVEAWFESQGFDLVDPGDLTFDEQLRRIRGADCIVGPDGAAFFALLFARPGTRIGMLAQPALEANEWWNQMYEELGLSLLLYVGTLHKLNPDYQSQSDVIVDVAGLPGFLEELQRLPRDAVGEHGAALPPLRVPAIDYTKSYFPVPDRPIDAASPEGWQPRGWESLQECFTAERFDDVLSAIEWDGAWRSPAAKAVELVTRAGMARARSDAPTVNDCIDGAHALGVPLALVLRECGRHYLDERAHFARAYECFATLEQFEAGSMGDFVDKLPPEWMVRLAPAIAAWSSTTSTSGPEQLKRLAAALLDALGAPGAAMMLAEIEAAQDARQN